MHKEKRKGKERSKQLRLENKCRTEQDARDKQSFIDSIPETLAISFSASLEAGNCSIGTEHFCTKHNLNKRSKYNARELYLLEPKNKFLQRATSYAIERKPVTQTPMQVLFSRGRSKK